ncbi:DNA-binding protein RFX6 [Araneus ventricosus]|uniref:DNA-binding protein RFX6 n=1 Tax=Araneus ventricosus TaxID=182803 RepID=A0A4Y2EX77_ARAVE|nr:DNA-binding protein RFX6 [Araneus ventricosus]
MSIFEHSITLDLIPVCDSILYRTLTDILLPSDLMEMPERLLREVQNVALHWKNWLECSLENMPSPLKELKMTQGKRFSNALKRYVAFLHLSQVPVLNKSTRLSLSRELSQIEEQHALHDWLLNIDSCVIKYLLPTSGDNAQITFHLFAAILQEYLLLAFESQQYQEKENVLYTKLKKHLNTTVYNTDYLKSPTSCFLVTLKKELNSRQKAQEKIVKDASLRGVQSKLNWKQSSESSSPVMSSRDQDNFWKADYLTSKFPEINFVKNEMRLPDFPFQQIQSEFSNREVTTTWLNFRPMTTGEHDTCHI